MISPKDLYGDGSISKQAVYKAIRAGKLKFMENRADVVKLLAQWRAVRDPSRDDKIGPALERIIEARGLKIPSGKTKPIPVLIGEPATEGGSAPAHLSPAMRQFWARVASEYDLEADALLILRTACEAWDRAQQAREAIAHDGLVINGRRHPAVDIEATSQGLFLRAMRTLGLDIEAPGPVGRPAGR